MKTLFCCTCICFASVITFNISAQQWPGYETGRFTGISSANMRPGGMAPMPYKVDVTLFGAHLFTEPKNIFSKDLVDVTFSGVFNKLSGFSQLSSNRTMVLTNLQGPSALVQVTPKVSVGFAWNVRFTWLSDFSQPEVTKIFDTDETSLDFEANNERARVMFMGWNEFGLGAGGVVWEEDFHSFSIGAFAKLVYGLGNMNLNMEEIYLTANADDLQNVSFRINSEISENVFDLVDEGRASLVDRAGYGFDLGAEYKFINPRACPGGSNYRLKAGFALNDIGKARYNSAWQYSNENKTVVNSETESLRNTSFRAAVDTFRQIYSIDETPIEDYSVTLPMSLRLYTEVNIQRRAIVYTEFHFMFAQLTNPEMPVLFRYNLTPRFEDDRFGIYVPLTFTNYIPASAGLAIRLKPLIIGCGNLFTFWAYEDRGTPIDLFVKLKIPILNDDERVDWKTMMMKRK